MDLDTTKKLNIPRLQLLGLANGGNQATNKHNQKVPEAGASANLRYTLSRTWFHRRNLRSYYFVIAPPV